MTKVDHVDIAVDADALDEMNRGMVSDEEHRLFFFAAFLFDY